MLIDSEDNFYIADCKGRIFKSIDNAETWTEIGDMNPGTNDPKGLAEFVYNSNLTFLVRNCSEADCSDGTWQEVNLDDINLTGRYFQYKAIFTTQNKNITPSLKQVSIDYTILNSAPTITLFKPQEGTTYGYNESLPLEFSAFDNENNIETCWYNIDSGENITIVNCENTTFNVSEGSHTLTIYVNDSYGLMSWDSVSFSVQIGAPTITLISPINVYLLSLIHI